MGSYFTYNYTFDNLLDTQVHSTYNNKNPRKDGYLGTVHVAGRYLYTL